MGELRDAVMAAIDADLKRQAAVQADMGCAYFPADLEHDGVAGADMNIVLAEVAAAIIPIVTAACAEVARDLTQRQSRGELCGDIATAIERLGDGPSPVRR